MYSALSLSPVVVGVGGTWGVGGGGRGRRGAVGQERGGRQRGLRQEQQQRIQRPVHAHTDKFKEGVKAAQAAKEEQGAGWEMDQSGTPQGQNGTDDTARLIIYMYGSRTKAHPLT